METATRGKGIHLIKELINKDLYLLYTMYKVK